MQVLQRLRVHRQYLKLERCEFHCSTVQFLGYNISPEGIQMDLGKVNAILEWPLPQSVKELQRFLGFANFKRHFSSQPLSPPCGVVSPSLCPGARCPRTLPVSQGCAQHGTHSSSPGSSSPICSWGRRLDHRDRAVPVQRWASPPPSLCIFLLETDSCGAKLWHRKSRTAGHQVSSGGVSSLVAGSLHSSPFTSITDHKNLQ